MILGRRVLAKSCETALEEVILYTILEWTAAQKPKPAMWSPGL